MERDPEDDGSPYALGGSATAGQHAAAYDPGSSGTRPKPAPSTSIEGAAWKLATVVAAQSRLSLAQSVGRR